jgi:hypothetical protein
MGIELPAELADVAASAGVRWPRADETAMRASARAWRTAGGKVAALAKEADGTAHHALSAVRGDTGTAAQQHWNTFVAPDTGHLTSTAKGCTDAADRLDHAADQVGAAKVQIVRHLVNLAQQRDAAHQAAAAGHPTALAGLPTTVHHTATNVAQVNHSLTTSIRLDTPTGQPPQGNGHGGTDTLLGPSGPPGPPGPLAGHGVLGASGPVAPQGPPGSHDQPGDNGSFGGAGPLVAMPMGHGGDQISPVTHDAGHTFNAVTHAAGPTLGDTLGSVTGQHSGGYGAGVDPGHTGLISGGTIGAGGSPVVAPGLGPVGPGLGNLGGPGLGNPGGPGLGSPGPGLGSPVGPGHIDQIGAVGQNGSGQIGQIDPTGLTGPGHGGQASPGATDIHGNAPTPPLGVTVQSAAPAVAPQPTFAQSGSGIVIPPTAQASAPVAPPPPMVTAPTFTAPTFTGPSVTAPGGPSVSGPSAGGPAGVVPEPPSGPPPLRGAPGAPVSGAAAPARNWVNRPSAGSADVVPIVDARPGVTGPAAGRPGRGSTVPPPNQDAGTTPLAVPGAGRQASSAPRGDAVALFLVYLFPLGQLPRATTRPVRQLPPPAPETDFAAGLRFPPHDHPASGLIDVTSALDTPPQPAAHPGFAEGDLEVAALAEGHDPLGGGNERDWDRRFLVRAADPAEDRAAEYAWPPGELFPEGGCASGEPVILPAGTVIDRFGTPEGRVFGEDGAPFARRSLPPDHLAAGYHRYRVTRELPVWRTLSAAWFGQPGGAVRYRAVYPAADLVALGYLTDITGTDHGH